ncbi:glycosyltransferase [Pontimonas sp.]|nr:glycosyltransferase [Pontimonas sp.]
MENEPLDLTVLVVASPVKSHPSTRILDETLESLKTHVNIEIGHPDVPFVISHDGLSTFAPRYVRKDFEGYLDRVRDRYPHNTMVVRLPRRRGLTQNIANGLAHVATPFVLIVQHDLPFCSPVDFGGALAIMRSNEMVKHLRFNRFANDKAGWDAGVPPALKMDPKIRSSFFREIEMSFGLKVMQTLNWSDNNHLTPVSYYPQVVFPVVGRRRIPPERAMIPLVTPENHPTFGTYVWGGAFETAVISHSDGREFHTSILARVLDRYNVLKRARHAVRMQVWRMSYWASTQRFERFRRQ